MPQARVVAAGGVWVEFGGRLAKSNRKSGKHLCPLLPPQPRRGGHMAAAGPSVTEEGPSPQQPVGALDILMDIAFSPRLS